MSLTSRARQRRRSVPRPTRTLLVGVAVATLALCAACSGGGKPSTDQSSGAAGKADTPKLTVAMVTHSAPGDTFWDQVRKGAQAAADKDNVDLQYSADPDGTKQASLVQTAIDKKVDGIAVTLAKPDAMKSVVQSAVSKGIPVDGLNSGQDQAASFGLIGFFGQDELVAGEAAGAKLASAGAKNIVCVIHEQGNVGLDDRCKGVKEKVSNTTILYVTGSDMNSVSSKMVAKLQQDKSVDWVVTLGAPFAMTAVQAISQTKSTAKLATFDTNADAVKAISAGTIQWAVDQQPYLQGYLAVDALWLYKTNGDTIGGGKPTLTGPAFVDKSNASKVAEYAARGTR